MSDKKDPGTALVPMKIEKIDRSLVPCAGYENFALIEDEKIAAKRAFMRTAGLTGASTAAVVGGLLLTGVIPITAPYFILVALLMTGGAVGMMAGSLFSMLNVMRLVNANRFRSLPPGDAQTLALMEGAAHALVDGWNTRAESWEEGWRILEKEERDLFDLQDRCISDKSRKGLVKRIEYVRKEKRKHLRVRAKLEVERDRILAAIESLRKRLPPPPEPLMLKMGDEDPT